MDPVEPRSAVESARVGLSQDELAVLMRLNQAMINRRERPALVQAIAEAVRGVLRVDRVAVVVADSSPTAVSIAVDGRGQPEDAPLPHALISAWVVDNAQPLVVSSPDQIR